MTKTEFLEVLAKELDRLETVEHVSDLANNGWYDEVDVVIAEIDYTAINEYMDSVDYDGDLKVSEIPGERYLAFVIYLRGSGYDECDVMESWQDLQKVLRDCGEAGEAIAATMEYDCVDAYDTFAEFVRGESNGDDKDDCEDDNDEADGDCEEDEEESDESCEE